MIALLSVYIPSQMTPLLFVSFILCGFLNFLPLSFALPEQQQQPQLQPILLSNRCNDSCGKLQIPFPFHLKASCGSVSSVFRLSCSNSSALFLNIGSESYPVLEFFSDGILVDFPDSTSCRVYNDLNSFGFKGNEYFGISVDNVIGLYDCEDSSLCKAACETDDLPGCDNNTSGSPACCYPLDDRSVWRVGDDFAVFSKFGCRGFSSWVIQRGSDSGKRGVKLEWAIPRNLSNRACASNSYIANATAIEAGIRCLCQDGYVGDGLADGLGCLKSCFRDGQEACGSDCCLKRHGDRRLVIAAGVLAPLFILASLVALLCILSRIDKPRRLDPVGSQFCRATSFQKTCRTRVFTYHELAEATKGFGDNQKLVDSKNGKMYTGLLGEGLHVAVHNVRGEHDGDLINLLSKIEVLSSVEHRNLARLHGCCILSGFTALVVYDYPANGNLSDHLRYHEGNFSLDWFKRLKIAAETASILAFLQYEIFPPIFHNDLNSGYIFLDDDFSAKVAGFRLLNSSLAGGSHQSRELESSGPQRNDVYDLGVLLVEIIAGAQSSGLQPLALQMIRSGKLEEVVDPVLRFHEQPPSKREQIERVANLASRCMLFGGNGELEMVDVARELIHLAKENMEGGSMRGPALEETFSNSSLLQMISMSPESIYVP